MWYVGQKIVCVDNSGCPELENGKTYTILKITKCPKCNSIGFVIEASETNPKWQIEECGICGDIRTIGYPYQDYKTSRFRPLEYDIIDNKELLSNIVEERSDVEIKKPEKV